MENRLERSHCTRKNLILFCTYGRDNGRDPGTYDATVNFTVKLEGFLHLVVLMFKSLEV